VEEVERARKAKEDRIRREVWERQNGIVPEEPVGEDGKEDGAEVAEGEKVNGTAEEHPGVAGECFLVAARGGTRLFVGGG
jgi:hypothetical protein